MVARQASVRRPWVRFSAPAPKWRPSTERRAMRKNRVEPPDMPWPSDPMQNVSRAGTLAKRYTHKTSGFKTSGFKTSGFKTFEMSGLQNVGFPKCQVYKTSGLQNVRLQKNIHTYSVLVVGGNPQVLLQPCLQAKWWLFFILYFIEGFLPYITIIANNK